MCLEIPALVQEVDPDGLSATVTAESRTHKAVLVALDPGGPPIRPGDWLLVHSGVAVERITEDQALDLLDLIGQARAAGEEA